MSAHPNAPGSNGVHHPPPLVPDPPSDTHERWVLGCILLRPALLLHVENQLGEADFRLDLHRSIFRVMVALRQRNLAPDPAVVEAELAARGVVVTLDRLVALSDAVATPSSLPSYLELVKQASAQRALLELAGSIQRLAADELDLPQQLAYVKRELARIELRTSGHRAERLPIIRVGDIPEPGPVRWLIDGLWTDGAFGILGAIPKSWKTFFTLQLAIAVASGQPLFGRHEVHRPGAVLMFGAEGGKESIRRRQGMICRALDLDIKRLNLTVIDTPVLRLDKPDVMDSFVSTVEHYQPALVILDPLRELHAGDENDSTYIADLLGPLRALKSRVGCSIMVVHHFSKPPADGKSSRRPAEQLRGTGALAGAIDSGIFLAANGEGEKKRVSVTALHRDAREPDSFDLRLVDVAHNDGPAIQLELAEKDDRDDMERKAESRTHLIKRVLRAITLNAMPSRTPLTSKRAVATAAEMSQRDAGPIVTELLQAGQIYLSADGYRPGRE